MQFADYLIYLFLVLGEINCCTHCAIIADCYCGESTHWEKQTFHSLSKHVFLFWSWPMISPVLFQPPIMQQQCPRILIPSSHHFPKLPILRSPPQASGWRIFFCHQRRWRMLTRTSFAGRMSRWISTGAVCTVHHRTLAKSKQVPPIWTTLEGPVQTSGAVLAAGLEDLLPPVHMQPFSSPKAHETNTNVYKRIPGLQLSSFLISPHNNRKLCVSVSR